jgi:Leucine-rich repeat (LRR) protein
MSYVSRDLSFNKLTTVPALETIPSLKYFTIANNPVKYLSSDISQLPHTDVFTFDFVF